METDGAVDVAIDQLIGAPSLRSGGEWHVESHVWDNTAKRRLETLTLEEGSMAAGDEKKGATQMVVGTMRGLTLDLPNYKSVKVSVWAQMACTDESRDKTYVTVSQWVEDRVDYERCKVRKVIPEAGILKRLGKTEVDFLKEAEMRKEG